MIELVCTTCGKGRTASPADPAPPTRCRDCSGVLVVKSGADPAPAAGPEGSLVGSSFGKYAISAEIGRGSMGVVYDAQDTLLHRRVALKVMHAGRGGEPREAVAEWQRFMQEARLTANVAKHPNIVTVYEAAVHDSRRYIAMEYVAGEPMQRWRPGRSSREQVRLLRDVALAVHHAHEHGIIHRDLKPANVLVAKGGVPVVTDFGLARFERKNAGPSLTPSGFVVGSPAYMSPEQARGQQDVDRTTDVYAIGIMLYEAIAGRPPFEGKNPIETLSRVVEGTRVLPSQALPLPEVDPALDKICMKAMSLNARDRYAGCADLARELTAWLEQGRPVARPRLPLWQIATFAALCATLAGVLILNKRTADRREVEFREQLADTMRQIEALKAPVRPPPGRPIVLQMADFRQDGNDPYNSVTPSKLTFQRPCLFDTTVTLPDTADYVFTITASCDQARNEFAKFAFFVDGKKQGEVELLAERAEDYSITARCSAGERRIGIRFLNDFYVAKPREDRNLYVHNVTIRRAK
ncbi:MAG: protein kinase [Planctomycetes bacterium]|nr:protein kinase [Planctomycetota bacterium]